MTERLPDFISLGFEKKKKQNTYCFVSMYMERNVNNSDNLSAVTERPSDFISLESEKKKKALFSKHDFTVTENHMSFVSLKKKHSFDKILLKDEVKLFSDSEHVMTSSVFFETEGKSLDLKNDSDETEQQILSDIDITVQIEKLGVEIKERIGKDIYLKEKKKHHLRQIVWLPRNWLPLPRLDRDAIVGFFEGEMHDGHDRPCLEHEELRKMLRQLASDDVPGPQITMKYEILRLCTMKTFPGQDRPFAIRIIGAGFYYAGHQDQVICYCCGIRKDHWVIGDIPLLIHQNMAPACGFLTHNALVNVPIRKVNSTASPSPAEVRLLAFQRSCGSNQSDTAQGKPSSMLPSSEHNWVSISNMSCQILIINRALPSDLLIASGRQNVLDSMQAVTVEETHPQYAVKNMRINSFQGWPAEHRQRPEEMAECGFYYAGFSDCVRCFCCGLELRHWMSEDNPWIEHARWAPSCIYVLKMKGEEFVSLVKMAVEIAEREKAVRSNSGGNRVTELSSEAAQTFTANEVASSNSNIANSMTVKGIKCSTEVTGGNVTEATVSTLLPGKTEIQKYLLTDAAQSVLSMGYQPKLVQQAIERVLLKKGTEQLTGQIILEAVFEIEKEKRVQPNPRGYIQSAEGHKSIGKEAEVTEDETSEELQTDPEKKMREHSELHKATLCRICLENTSSVVLLPCGHLVICPDCAPAMRNCPICNALVKGIVYTSTT